MRSSMSSAVYAAAVSCRSTRRRVSTTGSRLVTFVSRSGGLNVEAEALTFKRYQGPGWGLPAVVACRGGCVTVGQGVQRGDLRGVGTAEGFQVGAGAQRQVAHLLCPRAGPAQLLPPTAVHRTFAEVVAQPYHRRMHSGRFGE